MANRSIHEIYASDIYGDVTPERIVEACVEGAHDAWNGNITVEIDDGRPVVIFGGTTDEAGPIITEAYAVGIAQFPGCHRLFTLQVIDNAKMGGICGWSMHCFANDLLNDDPVSPITGDAAQQSFQDSQGSFVLFSK